MKNFARSILGEDTGPWSFFAGELFLDVVVFDLAAGLFFRRKRNVIGEIEIAAKGRHPMKPPAHALFEGFDFGERSTRRYHKRGIAIGKVNGRTVKMICQVRAAWAALLPAGTKHEVVHNELAAAVEKIGQRYLALA